MIPTCSTGRLEIFIVQRGGQQNPKVKGQLIEQLQLLSQSKEDVRTKYCIFLQLLKTPDVLKTYVKVFDDE